MKQELKELWDKLDENEQEILIKCSNNDPEKVNKNLKLLKDIYDYFPEIKHYKNSKEKVRRAYGILLNKISVVRKQKKSVEKKLTIVSDEKEVKELLKDPKLMDKIIKAVQLKSRVVGEEKSIKPITLVVISTKCINIEPTSKNLHPEDDSGAGKDFVIIAVGVIFKESGIVQWIHIENPSPKALTYLNNPESKEDAIEVTEKTVFHIEDADNAFINSTDFKLICSGEMDTVRVSTDRKSIRLKLSKPVLFVTSCDTSTGKQLHRRIPSMGLDTDVKQTIAILDKKTDDASKHPQDIINKKDGKLIQLIIDALKLLEDVYVIIPEEIGNKIKEMFGDKPSVIARTLIGTFQDYVKMSATLYQFQRTKSEENAIVVGIEYKTIIATEDDFEIARSSLKNLYDDFADEKLKLNKKQRAILEEFKKYPGIVFDIYAVLEWECHDLGYQTLRNYLEKIVVNSNLKMFKESGMLKYQYPGRVEPRPVKKKTE